MESHCMFQSMMDCSDTQELVKVQLTLTSQEQVSNAAKEEMIIFMKH